MKKNLYIKIISFFAVIFLMTAGKVLASTPTLSFSTDSNNSSIVNLVVNGDSNSSAILYYYSSSATGPQMKYLGTTNSSGPSTLVAA